MSTQTTFRTPIIGAAVWMVAALFSFMAMGIGGRELANKLTTFQILFFRSFIGLVIVSIVVARTGFSQLKTPKGHLHLLRNIAHYAGQYGWFYGLGFIPLASVFAIEFTVPIWVALLAALFLGEKLTRPRILAIALGIIGLLIILRPGLQTIHPAAFAVLGAAIGYATSHTFTKKLTDTESAWSIVFYMTLIQLPFGLIPSLWNWTTPALADWPWLILVGIAALTAHYAMSRAFALVDATVVSPMGFLRLPLSAIAGFLLYNEVFDWLVIFGAAIMLLGNWFNIRAEQSPQHRTKS